MGNRCLWGTRTPLYRPQAVGMRHPVACTRCVFYVTARALSRTVPVEKREVKARLPGDREMGCEDGVSLQLRF